MHHRLLDPTQSGRREGRARCEGAGASSHPRTSYVTTESSGFNSVSNSRGPVEEVWEVKRTFLGVRSPSPLPNLSPVSSTDNRSPFLVPVVKTYLRDRDGTVTGVRPIPLRSLLRTLDSTV